MGEVPADPGCRLRRSALLPGLVDTHVHINEPGRTEWEGFATATRAAAAGGYTTLVDMPLNCLPETTTVAALEAKREAARGPVHGGLGGLGRRGRGQPGAPVAAGPRRRSGFKCFLIYPGCDGFTMIDREQLERALPGDRGIGAAAAGACRAGRADRSGDGEAAQRRTGASTRPIWRRARTRRSSRRSA